MAVSGRGMANEKAEAGVPDRVMVCRIVAVGDEDVVVVGVWLTRLWRCQLRQMKRRFEWLW